MGHVFVSYSRRDKMRVDIIVEALTTSGIHVWIDRSDIKAGKTWRPQIVEAIDTCEAFILMLSPTSVLSDNVRKEIDLAQDSNRTIVPVMLETVTLSREIRYQLAGLQFIDIHHLGFEKSIEDLLTTVKEQLTNSQPQEGIVRQTELVIKGIDLASFGEDKKAELLDFLAKLCSTDQSNLTIAGTAAGSVHVFVNMPSASAFKLKTLALNREKRLKGFGIASLRITGDSKFVNVALGVLTTTATIGVLQLIWLSLPSLLPSVLGVATGKVILVTTAVVATTVVGVEVVSSVNNPAPPTPFETSTRTITPSLVPTQTPQPPVVSAKTAVPTQKPFLADTEGPTVTPTVKRSPTFTPTLTRAPILPLTYTPTPTSTLTITPSQTYTPSPTDTATDTPSPTDTPSDTPSPTDTPTDTLTPTITPSPTFTPTPTFLIPSYIRGIGDNFCPVGYTLATYPDAVQDSNLICSVLDTWDIARLGGGGSFDGPGYGCGFRDFDARSLGHSVCKAIP